MAEHNMEISCRGSTIPTTPNPKNLLVTFDMSLTYTKHLSQLSMKVNARRKLRRRLAGAKWAHTLMYSKHQQHHLPLLQPSIAHRGVEVPTHID